MKIQELQVGRVLSNNEIADIFQCSTQGGMRRSRRTNTLVLISDQMKLYHDHWIGDVLHYTGMGLIGDQDFCYMQNRTLYESQKNGVNVHLFEVLHPREYTYCGQVELCAEPYMSEQIDVNGNRRKACMFPLKRIEKNGCR